MRILFTGASSFTGYWFVQALKAAGHELVCPLRGAVAGYTGIRGERVGRLNQLVKLAPEVVFGSEKFLDLLRERGPWDLLCHHASEVTNYKSPDFDPFRGLASNTNNLRNVLDAFKQIKGKAVVLTGTVFEPDEGEGDLPLRAFSPYGLSKGLTWHVFRFYCAQVGLPLGKFVIPNPFGPWEEPRFTAHLMKAWKNGKPASVNTPDYLRDNIHVGLLAAVYAAFSERLVAGGLDGMKSNPSGYVESQGAFALRVAGEVRKRVNWPCAIELKVQEDFSEPMKRTNLEAATLIVPQWSETAAWDAFVEFYTRDGFAAGPPRK